MLVKSQVKYIQSLSQKKLRDEEKVFVAEGPKIINELLAAPTTSLRQLFALDSYINKERDLLKGIDSQKIHTIDQATLERISFQSSPNQVLGLFSKPQFGEPKLGKGIITLALDGIQDPGNLGTIIRTADWFGINTIIASEDCADAFNPKVVQSTMASIARVNIVYRDLAEFLKTTTVPVFAAVLEGKDLFDCDRITEGIIVIGNESRGIRPEVLQGSYLPITIPRKGLAESLNAAVATGIILAQLT